MAHALWNRLTLRPVPEAWEPIDKPNLRSTMQQHPHRSVRNPLGIGMIALLLSLVSLPSAFSEGVGNALKGVQGINAIFDYSQGSPKMSNIIFGAVKDLYENESVAKLPEDPQIIILFQGPAVKLISRDLSGVAEKDLAEVKQFHDMVREMKQDGVRFEVCLYAARVLGVDPATILPEIEQVDNGFVSSIGYQAQGYALVRVP